MRNVLIVDDDRVLAATLSRGLRRHGWNAEVVHDVAAASQRALAAAWDLVLLDIGLPDGSGIDLIERLREGPGRPSVVVITGRDDLEATVEAIQRGAIECLVKPLDLPELLTIADRVGGDRQGSASRRIEAETQPLPASKMLVGKSPQMRQVFRDIARCARSQATVLIVGETGVGKEVVARAIHESSGRSGQFVGLNCAAVSPLLFEAELFGHAKGAFTGADRDRAGRIEAAAGGLLFLDEIGELNLELQAKLLRFLQERTFERVGETRQRVVEARIVTATNRDLVKEVKAGRFREDLLYRLQVVVIEVPPLRRRAVDFTSLLDRLIATVAREAKLPAIELDNDAERALLEHSWPGNVRELLNTMRRIVIGGNSHIRLEHVQQSIGAPSPVRTSPSSQWRLADVEREHIARTLERYGWVKRRAAAALGISRARLDRKIVEFGLVPPKRTVVPPDEDEDEEDGGVP